MLYIIVAVLVLGLVCGPHLWVKYVLKKHHRHLAQMPGTGGELAEHLVSEYQLENVKVEQAGPNENHYSPADNAVRLSPDIYTGKSLTAVAVAAHEVGHAIQFNRKEPVSFLRTHYLGKAHRLQQLGVFFMMALPAVIAIFKLPQFAVLTVVIGIVTMLISVLMYVAILPEEFDASFNKALPILKKGGYVPSVYMPAIKQVLRACALTYVAAALIDILRLWRWLRFIR